MQHFIIWRHAETDGSLLTDQGWLQVVNVTRQINSLLSSNNGTHQHTFGFIIPQVFYGQQSLELISAELNLPDKDQPVISYETQAPLTEQTLQKILPQLDHIEVVICMVGTEETSTLTRCFGNMMPIQPLSVAQAYFIDCTTSKKKTTNTFERLHPRIHIS